MSSDALPGEFDVPLPAGFVTGASQSIGDADLEPLAGLEPLETEEGIDLDPALAFRRTLGMFATGVTVITTSSGGEVHGMTANAFMSVSLSPPLVLVSVDRRARMNLLLREGVRFGISVLADWQSDLSNQFGGRPVEGAEPARFDNVRDTPLVEGALAHLVARVVRSYWGGDHSLFLAHVEYVRYGEGEPLLFHGGRYERLVRDPRLLANLPPELLQPLLAAGVEREYSDGETIMRLGEAGDELLLVTEGAVRVSRPGRSLRLEVGEIVGEIEVLTRGGRIADVVAEGPTRCVVVERDDLYAALEAHPRAAIALIEMLAGRFRETA
jgi:flavin reductase (DIM6/NTAB) family NADH-FMN oxidoreductase RutF